MTLNEALDILAERLRTIDGLTVITDPRLPVVVPMAVVTEGELDYNESFTKGAAIASFRVVVYVAASDSTEGLYEARGYLSANGDDSVRAALETQIPAGDALLSKVNVKTGTRSESDNYITAVFDLEAHVPGPVAT